MSATSKAPPGREQRWSFAHGRAEVREVVSGQATGHQVERALSANGRAATSPATKAALGHAPLCSRREPLEHWLGEIERPVSWRAKAAKASAVCPPPAARS